MAFLGIRIPISAARLLSDLDVPGERIGMHEMHITILLFEDELPIATIAESLEAAYNITSKTEPFTVKIKKISCFPPKEGKPHPIIAIVESKELHELGKKLRRKFNKEEIEFNKTFKEYNPHITLAYADEAIKTFKIDPVEMVVQELVLFGGDHGDSRIFITFPLKSPGKHAALLGKCEVFEKWATKQ
jgi:2'-5' RNA ligase